MNLNLILEELLLELSGDEIYDKYYKNIDYSVFYQICMADPKTKEQDGRITYLGKYSKLLLDLYRRKRLNTEDLPDAKEYLNHIYDHSIAVNTNNIKSIPDLYELVKQYVIKKTPSLQEILKALDKSEYEVLYNGENWVIFKPLTEKSSCYLGVKSTWCTTWGPYSLNKEYLDRSNRFEYYNERDTIYIIVNKENNEIKYQFHFVEKQFMNLEDRQIDKTEFLDENLEVKYFFFPSLIKDVSIEQLKLERKRMFVLSNDDQQTIMKKFMEKVGYDNTLVDAIMNNDEEVVKHLVIDDNVINLELERNHISVVLSDCGTVIDETQRTLSWYEHDVQNAYERVSEDILDGGRFEWSDEYNEVIFQEVLKKFYEKNQSLIIQEIGYRDFETFKKRYFQDFFEDEGIRDAYIDFMIEAGVVDYEVKAKERVEEITTFLKFNRSYFNRGKNNDLEINLVKSNFANFLASREVQQITDMNQLIVDYIEENNLDYEYEGLYDYNTDTPTYDDDPKHINFVTKVDEFFDNIIGFKDTTQECVDAKRKLEQIIGKVFKGSKEFENDEVKLTIHSPYVDCTDYTVGVTYTNKNTGKTSKGKMKVDNITNYISNYALFEGYVKFKKLIR